jgi:hypothetical protein
MESMDPPGRFTYRATYEIHKAPFINPIRNSVIRLSNFLQRTHNRRRMQE